MSPDARRRELLALILEVSFRRGRVNAGIQQVIVQHGNYAPPA